MSSAGLLQLEQWNPASVKLPVTQPWRAILPAIALPSSTWKGMCTYAGEYNSSRQFRACRCAISKLCSGPGKGRIRFSFKCNPPGAKECAGNYEGYCLFSEHPFHRFSLSFSESYLLERTGIASLHYWEASKSAFIFIFKIDAYCKQFGKWRIKAFIISHYYSPPPQ